AVARATAIADSPEFEGTSIVSTIDAGTDRDAIAAALNTIRTRKPRSAVLLISPCEIEKKLTIVAAVPDALIKRGLNAGEWVRTAAAACGGKGGGKPDQAQGGGTDLEKIKDALDAAKAFAFAKCPN
ncbi:MAG: DHHA1 domain-containing protein, partial [Phycisphaerales bacterium]